MRTKQTREAPTAGLPVPPVGIGESSWDPGMPGFEDSTDPYAPAQPAMKPRKPNTLRLLVSHNRTMLAPWAWMAAADITAFTAHYGAPSLGQAALTAAGASATVAAGSLFHTREARLRKHIKTVKTRRKVQTTVRRALIAGSAWELLASTWTPIGPHGGMQLTLLGGGLALAAPHLWRNRRRPVEAEPVAAIAAPVEDPRISKFRTQFCATGPLKESRIHDTEDIHGGFRFAVECSLAYRGKFADVERLRDDIAALYDVPVDHVSVEHHESRSARRAVVTVLTETKAHERDEPWDGTSTYDPQTGTFVLGRFADGSKSRWQLHIPGSGACGGMCVGDVGSGKTGTMHLLASEAGSAKLCAACMGACTCPVCDPQRICAVWMGDPQRQPFGVWRGRADVTAWGPLSCVRMLSWLHAGMRHRADYFGRMEWTDHLGRVNYGKGWFDPTPEFPMVLGVIDEWSIIMSDPELSRFAGPLAEQIEDEGRKVGVRLLIGSQDADVEANGSRGFRNALGAANAISHRSDRLAKSMLNLEGNPADLPEGVHGVSYLRSYDKRSGIVQRTKHLPEVLRPGQTGLDVRAIAERIAADPITYDPTFLDAISLLGYTGPGQILDDGDGWSLSTLAGGEPSEVTNAIAEAGALLDRANEPKAAAPDVAAVREALGQRTDADLFDLMATTGLSALGVSRAVDALIADGAASQAPSGRYASC
jgi:hypothetical protein